MYKKMLLQTVIVACGKFYMYLYLIVILLL